MKMNRLVSIAAAAVMSLSVVSAMPASVCAEWTKSDKGYSYKSDDTGKKLTGWQTIGDGKYYFNKDGYALTGWVKISGSTYYFNGAKKGKMLTGWNKIGSDRFYFGSDGIMRTGFIKLSGKTYYFGSDGKMRTGKRSINGKVYDFGTDGVLKNAAAGSSKLYAPMNGFKWGMSCDDVIESGKFDKYLNLGAMVMVYDSAPYTYYIFDVNDKLVCAGYASDECDKYVPVFKKYFTDEGWTQFISSKEDGATSIVFSKGDSYGGVYYNGKTAMTMIFSEDLQKMISEGKDFSEIVSF